MKNKTMQKMIYYFLFTGLLTVFSCNKNDTSNPISNEQVISLKNGEEKVFNTTIEGKNTSVRIKLDSIIDKRPPREACSTIYTSLKYVNAYFEIQVNNQVTDTFNLRRVMCETEGDLSEKDYGFDIREC